MKSSFSLFILAITSLVIAFAFGVSPPSAIVPACALTLAGSLCLFPGLARGTLITAINIGEGFHEEKLNKIADAAIATRYFLVKTGSDSAHIAAVAATADKPLGVCPDAPAAAGDGATVQMLGATDDTTHCVANGAITVDSAVYSAGNGKVMVKPTAAGTYWKVGHARTASAADGDEIEVETMTPRKLVVVAALTQTSNATIAGVHSTAVNPTKADFDALLAEAGKLQADFYVLSTALSGDCDVTVATS